MMMNKVLKIMTLTSLLLVALFSAVEASATVYNWSRYDLSFETPDGARICSARPWVTTCMT